MISSSEKMKQEYCCTVVRIGECFPIEGADRIQRTLVNGMDMVISKDIKPGDIMIYAGNETQLNQNFLAANNLFGIGECELNCNASEVMRLKAEGKTDEAKALCGFFTKQCRVKMLKLKGTYSFGFLFKPSNLYQWRPDAKMLDFESMVGTDFDTFMGELLVKAYMPDVKKPRNSGSGKPIPKSQKFDALLGDTFPFHYDSIQLQRNIHKLSPKDRVSITVKVHGTSAVFRRTDCKIPVALKLWQKALNAITGLFGRKLWQDYTIGQDTLYASRTVLRNRYRNPKDKMTQTSDIYGFFNEIIGKKLDDDTTVYGEIFGFMPGESKYVQKGYDYGCEPGEAKFMPYRVVRKGIELDVPDVVLWTKDMIAAHPELEKYLYVMPVLYYGTLKELYPDVPTDDNWHEQILDKLKHDSERLGMEKMEPLCINKVPREGVCIRIDNDPVLENFKLKCSKFLSKESKAVDAGEVDMEMLESQ